MTGADTRVRQCTCSSDRRHGVATPVKDQRGRSREGRLRSPGPLGVDHRVQEYQASGRLGCRSARGGVNAVAPARSPPADWPNAATRSPSAPARVRIQVIAARASSMQSAAPLACPGWRKDVRRELDLADPAVDPQSPGWPRPPEHRVRPSSVTRRLEAEERGIVAAGDGRSTRTSVVTAPLSRRAGTRSGGRRGLRPSCHRCRAARRRAQRACG